MDKKLFPVFCLLCFVTINAYGALQNLVPGITQDNGEWMNKVGFLYQRNYYPYAVFENVADNRLYTYRTGISIYNLKTKEKEFGKNLTPWPHRIKMQGEGISWKVRPFLNAALGGDGEPIKTPGAQVVDTDSTYQLDTWNDYLGCYSKTPLRYGDVDSNISQELVLFLDNDLIVFSPSLQKTIFSTRLVYQDQLADDQIEVAYGEDSREDLIYQYYAASGDDIRINAPFPATRSYAKIFIGDFNVDKTADIILWRKLYESLLNSDSKKGFNKIADLFVHYQLVDGEYIPQDTTPETIQNWLTSANLTWSKGFPSVSECPDEEGKLIPEMHDPLLNDPDVLK